MLGEAHILYIIRDCFSLHSIMKCHYQVDDFSVHSNLSTSQSPSLDSVSKAFVKSMKTAYIFRFCFLDLPETEDHIRSALVVPKSTLGLRQDMWSNLIIQSVENYASHTLSSN